MKIYMSGPYTENPHYWTEVIEKIGAELIQMGHTPFMPHKHFYLIEFAYPIDYEVLLAQDLEWLGVCDAILYVRSSPGADRELKHAKELGLKIFYSIDEVYDEQIEHESRCKEGKHR